MIPGLYGNSTLHEEIPSFNLPKCRVRLSLARGHRLTPRQVDVDGRIGGPSRSGLSEASRRDSIERQETPSPVVVRGKFFRDSEKGIVFVVAASTSLLTSLAAGS
ncbi:hypothetical protein BDP55DRAFT_670235 [Colletotrichum godetiae]|uniref:Uncharacterized protein n=1 Tax=Colletotrichum godetiae TaxID=1209918 RepID=A0AAJ0AGF2_9PEZI|nr:uncharacterized protein BDP55DRAFT_670235 [Colletotrichum godetiae]KAK1673444.1 hypothetical protein BDP55DRAFT_670235 [Colletotrichum godetiae]